MTTTRAFKLNYHYSIRTTLTTVYRNITASQRRFPDFLVIGANKCGTTTLYNYLIEHPNIKSASKKEIHFFDNPGNFSKGVGWYRAQFPIKSLVSPKTESFITGEATPAYLFHPIAPQRVAKYLPDTKIIVMLRNPVDRAYSHYQMTCRNGNELLTFSDAISKESERIDWILKKMEQEANFYDVDYARYSYLSRGIYVDQLQRWTELFDQKQILVLKSEDFFSKPQAALEKTINFLGLSQWQPAQSKISHVGGYQTKMNPEIKHQLYDFFAPHNQRLYEFLGTSFNWEEMR